MFARLFRARRASSHTSTPRARPGLEILENRLTPATMNVNPVVALEQQLVTPFVQAANAFTSAVTQFEKSLLGTFNTAGSLSAQVKALDQAFILLATQGSFSNPRII